MLNAGYHQRQAEWASYNLRVTCKTSRKLNKLLFVLKTLVHFKAKSLQNILTCWFCMNLKHEGRGNTRAGRFDSFDNIITTDIRPQPSQWVWLRERTWVVAWVVKEPDRSAEWENRRHPQQWTDDAFHRFSAASKWLVWTALLGQSVF